MPGNTSKTLEQFLIHASPTPQEPDQFPTASMEPALTHTFLMLNTDVLKAQLLKPPMLIKSKLKSMPMDQWKLPSMSTQTS
jgi:hypothetical protein